MKYTSPIVVIILLFHLPIAITMETSSSGSYFDEKDDPHFRNAVYILARKINLAEYATITDIECRNGKITAYIHENTPKSIVTGRDSALKLIVDARNQYKDKEQLFFEIMSIRSPSAKRRVNLVTCFHGAQLCPDKSNFFSGVTHMLQSGGTLLLTAPLKSLKTTALLASLNKTTQKHEWQSLFSSTDFAEEYVPFESIEEVKKLLIQNNFLNVELEVEQDTPRFQNVKALAKYFAQDFLVFNTFRSLTSEQKGQFSNAVSIEYLTHISIGSSPDGTIEFPQLTIIAKATYHPYNNPFSGSWPIYNSQKKRPTP